MQSHDPLLGYKHSMLGPEAMHVWMANDNGMATVRHKPCHARLHGIEHKSSNTAANHIICTNLESTSQCDSVYLYMRKKKNTTFSLYQMTVCFQSKV
mmetsp:Transcript_133902/g.267233  ORF Transcript_133902/g.267233 Transcript_133902/m.267233 type:complete len:97 (-) Transcript_133902:108-398(-)